MKHVFMLAAFLFTMPLSFFAQNVSGDWDGDGRKETATVENFPVPGSEDSDFSSPDVVNFSKSSIPSIQTEGYWVTVNNLGDLNGDKKSELGVCVSGLNGTWGTYFIYTLKNGRWIQATKSFSVKVDILEMSGIVPVKKLGNGKARITYWVWANDDIRKRTKVVTISK